MRSFKFRLWFEEIREMIPFEKLHVELEDGEYTVWFSFNDDGIRDGLPIEDFKVMQYTGFKDANGTEIYEGDILQYDNGHRDRVAFVEGCFVMTGKSTFNYLYTALKFHNAEVVGNIYENPELLQEEY